MSTRQWVLMIACMAIGAELVAVGFFALCHVFNGDCRIAWQPGRELARVGQ